MEKLAKALEQVKAYDAGEPLFNSKTENNSNAEEEMESLSDRTYTINTVKDGFLPSTSTETNFKQTPVKTSFNDSDNSTNVQPKKSSTTETPKTPKNTNLTPKQTRSERKKNS